MADPLSNLGNAFYAAGQTYANRNYQLQDEERRRSQRLADVQSDRAYAKEVRGDEREYAEKQALDAQKRQIVTNLVNQGFLTLEDSSDPFKISAAVARAQQAGAIASNKDLIAAGFLDPNQAGNQQAVADALALQAAENQTTKNRGQAALNEAAAEYQRLNQQAESLEGQISSIQIMQPTEGEIRNRALQLAQMGDSRKKVSDKEISSAIPQAEAELRARAEQNAENRQLQMRNQIQLLRYQATQAYNRLNSIERTTGRFADPASYERQPQTGIQASGPRAATQADREAAMGTLIGGSVGGGGGQSSSPSAVTESRLLNFLSDPVGNATQAMTPSSGSSFGFEPRLNMVPRVNNRFQDPATTSPLGARIVPVGNDDGEIPVIRQSILQSPLVPVGNDDDQAGVIRPLNSRFFVR